MCEFCACHSLHITHILLKPGRYQRSLPSPPTDISFIRFDAIRLIVKSLCNHRLAKVKSLVKIFVPVPTVLLRHLSLHQTIRNLNTGQPYSERELIKRVKRGDRDAQYLLYGRYVDAMYHTVIRMVKQDADAQDIVQECFVKVFEKIHTYREDASLGAWIKRIAINMAINRIRKQKRSFEYSDDISSDNIKAVPVTQEAEPFDATVVHNAIKELPSGCRTIVNLYAFEGYSHKEIASILDVSESTSKTQYRRAKSLLHDALKQHIESYGI